MITPEQIITEARTWKGTPFMGHVRVKGIGCDCVQFVVGAMINLGIIPKYPDIPRYTLGAGSHIGSSLVSEWVTKSGLFTAEETAQSGDVIGLQLGRVIHHVGIVTTDCEFIHAVEVHGVVETRFTDPPWAHRVKTFWRLK